MKLKQTLIGMTLLCVSTSAFAQKTDFSSVIANKDIPFTLKLKDLSGDWRRMKIVGTMMTGSGMEGLTSMIGSLGPLMQMGMMSEMGKGAKGAAKDKGMDAMMPMMASMMGGMFGGEAIYYTKGQTVEMGSETFIVTYRHKKPDVNLGQMMLGVAKPGEGEKAPDPAKMMEAGKLNPESEVTLNLLNTKAIGTINDLRPFDMQKEIDEAKAGMAFAEMVGAGGGEKAVEIAPDEKASDAVEAAPMSILGEVQRVIANDATVGKFADAIQSRVENNVVILTGTVKTAQQKARITNLVNREIKAIGGSYTLRNSIMVK